MTTKWAHLSNAAHIDAVLASLKANPDEWYAAWGAAQSAAWYAARDAAWYAARDAAWCAARDARRHEDVGVDFDVFHHSGQQL